MFEHTIERLLQPVYRTVNSSTNFAGASHALDLMPGAHNTGGGSSLGKASASLGHDSSYQCLMTDDVCDPLQPRRGIQSTNNSKLTELNGATVSRDYRGGPQRLYGRIEDGDDRLSVISERRHGVVHAGNAGDEKDCAVSSKGKLMYDCLMIFSAHLNYTNGYFQYL